MHLSDAEFGWLTLRQLDALLDRLEQQQERDEWRLARLSALIVNCNPFREGEAMQPQDFMPEHRPGAAPEKQPEVNRGFAEWLSVESSWAERQARERGARMKN